MITLNMSRAALRQVIETIVSLQAQAHAARGYDLSQPERASALGRDVAEAGSLTSGLRCPPRAGGRACGLGCDGETRRCLWRGW